MIANGVFRGLQIVLILMAFGCASSPAAPPSIDCTRFALVLRGLDGSDPTAISALLNITPTNCAPQRQAIEAFQQTIERNAWLVASADGSVHVTATPPTLPSPRPWPWRLSDEQMLARPSPTEIEQFNPPRARERDVAGGDDPTVDLHEGRYRHGDPPGARAG